jgi:hypothetical protein
MKKFRMMLPMLAVVFAVVGAVGGNFLPGIPAYYKLSSTNCSSVQTTEQSNCQVSDDSQYPLCTIAVGFTHEPAWNQSNCTEALRVITPR